MSKEQRNWLNVLILMHDHGFTSYSAFMDHVFEQWYDRCLRCEHARIVKYALCWWA